MKKKCITLIVLLVLVNMSRASSIEGFVKTWGLLKYYSEGCSNSNVDWDNTFTLLIDRVGNKVISIEEATRELTKISKVNSKDILFIEEAPQDPIEFDDLLNINGKHKNIRMTVSVDWIWDTTLISIENRNYLYSMLINYTPFKNNFINYWQGVATHLYNSDHSKDLLFYEMSLLAIATYWNVIEYYYPYKDIIDNDWNDLLSKYLTLTKEVDGWVSYYNLIKCIAAETNDAHSSNIYFPPRSDSVGKQDKYITQNIVPIKVGPRNGKLVVNCVFGKTNFFIGDEILEVNKTLISNADTLVCEFYTNNYSKLKIVGNYISYNFFMGNKIEAKVIRGADTITIKENLLTSRQVYKTKIRDITYIKHKIINDTLFYLNLPILKVREFVKVYRKIDEYSNVIIDLRLYPETRSTIFLPTILGKKPQGVANYDIVPKKFPGFFEPNKRALTYKFPNVFLLKMFKGKVHVLIDNNTISRGETECMIIKAYRNDALFYGAPTRGSNGVVVDVNLPGGVVVPMTSVNYYFANGKRLQRKGVIPDLLYEPDNICNKNEKWDDIINELILKKEKDNEGTL